MTYNAKEVRGLVEGYAELREKKSTYGVGSIILIRLADLDRAIALLQPKEYQAILLHGLLGQTIRDAETLLGVSKSTLYDRYDSGIAWLVRIMNEGVVA